MLEETLHRLLPGGLNDNTLHKRLIRGIHSLPLDTAQRVLEDFERTLVNTRSEIRNPAAYLNTVIQRTVANLEEEKHNPKAMPVAIAQRLNVLYTRYCNPEEIDSRCKSALAELDERSALRAVDELEGNDRSSVKNLSAFFYGIIQKFLKKPGPPNAAGGPPPLQDLDPPPPFLPRELLYGNGNDEYVPEMPRKHTDSRVPPRVERKMFIYVVEIY